MAYIEDSKKVEIHIRPNTAKMHRLGTNADVDILYNKEKVGAAYAKSGDILRGLSRDEEKKYLPRIIGTSTTDVSWEQKTYDYWANMGIVIPPPRKDGTGGGLSLEVGFAYPNEQAAIKGRAEEAKEATRFTQWLEASGSQEISKIRRFEEDFSVRQTVGEPINIIDYIVYRFCLVRTNIALDIKFIDNSAKIKFYLKDSGISAKAEHAKLLARREANKLYAEMADDRKKIKLVLTVMTKEVQLICQSKGYSMGGKNAQEEDLILDEIVNTYPALFKVYAEDKNLSKKALIENCITAGILRRMPHSDTIYYGDNTLIGNSMQEAVNFISDAKNTEIVNEINARIKTTRTVKQANEETA